MSPLLVLAMLPLGFLMNSPSAYITHKSIGLIILMVMIGRTFWRLTNPSPSHHDLPSIFRLAAYVTHLGLYITILTMAFSGWMMSTASGHPPRFLGKIELAMPHIPLNKTLAKLAHETHEIVVWGLISLISLHILAAIYHTLLDVTRCYPACFPDRSSA
ncbi:MAG: cytochrome b/b6 domain-containing protein [Gammaproteobacteria bacterium]|nr:cytochrome b/b6 domain-containing protein [Gammaproteobacteria bacterium]